MNCFGKRKIAQLLEQWERAGQEMLYTVKQKNTKQIAAGLNSLQDLAIEIGSSIEQTYGRDTQSVKRLEAYCESVYQLYQKLNENFFHIADFRELYNQAEQIGQFMDQELPDRYQAVFLPYKVSMWDSLESVWRAAADDPDCEALIVPIPYYTKNPDGSIGEEHYEGNLFPDNIPIMDYREIDLYHMRPDVIYIHNPYDNCNRITTVHPSYYAKALKGCAKTLVYVPYFVLNGEKVVEELAIVPGVFYADYIIVQNENEKLSYIKAFQKNQIRLDIERRLLPLGTPKIDRMHMDDFTLCRIPEAWKKKIGHKKVIFYNTSINAILKYGMQYLRKMQSVFSYFEHRADAALIWRPHPLIEDAVKSMRLRCYESYLEIKDRFLNGENLIFDEMEDPSWAMAVSNAYYGDKSSLIWLYRETGKRILLQNEELFGRESDINFIIEDMAFVNNKFYILVKGALGIWEYSLEQKEFCILTEAACNSYETQYCLIVENEGQLILPPFSKEEMLLYDIKEKTARLERISVANKGRAISQYKGAVGYQDHIFFIGEPESPLLKYNKKTGAAEVIDSWEQQFEEKYGYQTFLYHHRGEICKVEESFFVPLAASSMIMEYNMKSGQVYFYHVGNISMQFVTICYDGKRFWLSGNKPFLICWEKERNITEVYDCFPEGFAMSEDGWEDLFSRSFPVNEFVYFAPLKANMIIRINIRTKEIEKVRETGIDNICFLMKKWGKSAVFFQILNQSMTSVTEDLLLDLENHVISRNIFFVDEKNLKGIEKTFQGNEINREMNMKYLDYIIEEDLGRQASEDKKSGNETIGSAIYHAIKQKKG